MSALAGWVDFESDGRKQESLLRSMLAVMKGRGHDGEALWLSTEAGLGHCRTAISRSESASQPWIQDPAGQLVAVACTGQIYNSSELESQLDFLAPGPPTRSSAEIVARAYSKWGSAFVERMYGMFAFVLWDQNSRTLLLGRDRLGLQPLYYHAYGRGILFASLPQAILLHPRFEATLDITALPIVLQPRLALPGETPLRGLRELRPAHTLIFRECGAQLSRYWRLHSAPHPHTFDQTVTHVRGLLEDIVANQVDTAAPCGAMLSGGVDSTSIAALATAIRRRRGIPTALGTFCLKFQNDEQAFVSSELRPDVDAPFAMLAADHIGSRHSTLTLSATKLQSAIPDTRVARGLPGWGQFDASMYALFGEMRQHCRVALTGEAADELFGGYPYYFKHEFIARPHFPWLGDGPKLSDHLIAGLATGFDPRDDERERYVHWLTEVPTLPGEDATAARMREVQFLGMAGPLAVILDRKERMSMAQGLEVRIPFCDHRLVQYLWNVPWEMKCRGGVKGLLKAAFQDLLPPATLMRKKSAYPHIQDGAYASALIQESRDIINASGSVVAGLFDRASLGDLIDRIEAQQINASMLPGGASPAHLLIQLVEMHHWIRDYRISVH